MRKVTLCVLVAAAICAAQPDQPSGGVIEGIVTDLAGSPLAMARIQIRAAGKSVSVNTKDDGAFRFEGLAPGRYTLSAVRSGYVSQFYGADERLQFGSEISLSKGQSVTGLKFRLTPQSTIFGRVANEAGEPLAGARVELYLRSYGKARLTAYRSADSGPDGSFGFGGLGPGRYYVAALRTPDQPAQTAEGPNRAYVPSFYPSALRPSDAAPLDVQAGREIRGIEIRMRMEPVYRIAGSLQGGAGGSFYIRIDPKEPSIDNDTDVRSVRVSNEGSFALDRVSPGEYVLTAFPVAERQADGTFSLPALYGRGEVSITDRSITGFVLPIAPAPALRGTIAEDRDGNPEDRKLEDISFRVRLRQPRQTNDNAYNVPAGSDGGFGISSLKPAEYTLQLFGSPEDAFYIKRVRFNGSDVDDDTLDLTAGGGQLDILVSGHPAEIKGAIKDDKGSPRAGVRVSVWRRSDAGVARLVTSRFSDADGGYRLFGLAPGEYRVAAWESIEVGLDGVPEFLEAFRGVAAKVDLREGETRNLEPPLVDAEAIRAAAAKLN